MPPWVGQPGRDEVYAALSSFYGRPAERIGYSLGQVTPRAAAATAGVYRLYQHGARNVNLFCKVLHLGENHPRWPAEPDELDPMYWKREAQGYASGMFDTLTGGLRAPRCYGVFERDDGTVGIWLEDVRGDAGTTWPVDRYAIAARQLGRLQGHFVRAGAPAHPWLARRWLHAYVDRRAPDMTVLEDDDAWQRSLPRASVAPFRDAVARLWAERERFLAAVQTAPATLCHNDFHADNLFGVAGGATAVIDWAYAGIGALGEDAGNLWLDTLLDGFVSTTHAASLERGIWRGYREGLHDAGWDGDQQIVRLTFCASAAIKFAWIAPHMARLAGDPDALGRIETARNEPVERFFEMRAACVRAGLDAAEEARGLMVELGM